MFDCVFVYSGNQMGDYGARILSKVLLINRRLTHLQCDRNNISVIGLSDIATALQRLTCFRGSSCHDLLCFVMLIIVCNRDDIY